MNVVTNNSGFSLIELLVTAVIIAILAGVAIVAYIGVQEKAKISRVIRTASSASSDLQSWLHSSLSDQRDIIEIDSNMDQAIDSLDLPNKDLFNKVATLYVAGRTKNKDASPWFNRPMWNNADPPLKGSISLTQPETNQLKIVAKEKNGFVVYENIFFMN